ncbi:heat stress transcription factor A-6b-like [Hibiscus syriacus]|uniref:Heat stress transcription factor A-6b-like n=1 Tax=Hibiscus syriacus TaxID=106335 RepID=A0A6A3D5F8_HIBSY|nr:heat stress transcription factor A-6b-like [Hibiscus syriacus]
MISSALVMVMVKYDIGVSTMGAVQDTEESNRRTLDVLAARLYFYYSLCYELTGSLAEIRSNLLALHRIATLRHDELGQETLLNLLLRNFLHYNLYDQAEKLRSKAPRFEAHSNQQASHNLS